MQPLWWAALSKVADIKDYDDEPLRSGDLSEHMTKLVEQCSAFVAILSGYYIKKDTVVEHEFRTAAERFSDPGLRDLFRVIIIDPDAKQWWDDRRSNVFEQHGWLKEKIYWPLIDGNRPALLTGDLKPRYAWEVRKYAEELAASITASPQRQHAAITATPSRSIILLGHPRAAANTYTSTNAGVVRARQELAAGLRARNVSVSEWEDGWLFSNDDKREQCARQLRGPPQAIIRPLGSDEAIEAVVSPQVSVDQLSFLAETKVGRAEIFDIKISLWLPSEYREKPEAKSFVEKVGKQPAGANPNLCVAGAQELVELLARSCAGGKITQISIEELDDIKEIENGRTARNIVEDHLRRCFLDGANRAKLSLEPPLIRQFLNYKKLANQLIEAKDGRIILVAHDLQEHQAANAPDALRMLGRKVRNLKDSVESFLAAPCRGRLIPITLVVTNYENLQNDFVLDEEIAGIKWWLLSGQLAAGKFSPDPEVYEKIVDNISRILQEPGAGT